MMNWLNRQNSPTTPAAAYPQPSIADWRSRKRNDIQRSMVPGPERALGRNRKFKYLELFFFAVVISLIVGVDLSIFSINKRLRDLESELVEVKDWAFPASLLEGKYASLNARLRTLSEAYDGLDARFTSVSAQQESIEAAGDEAMSDKEEGIPSEAPAAGMQRPTAAIASDTEELTGIVRRAHEGTSTATQHLSMFGELTDDATVAAPHAVVENPVKPFNEEAAIPASATSATHANSTQGRSTQGTWVINLLSDPNEALAKRFAASARDHGVPVEQNRTEVKGRVFWRVQITGFKTVDDAQVHAEEVKGKLHLKDVWIFKDHG